ncbi:MAG: DUF1553 domain-containing protein [Verrucomicrobiota bacterium]
MPRTRPAILATSVLGSLAFLTPTLAPLPLFAAAAPAPLQFNRDIRPILSDKCFGCHGPDSGHRKAGLRLDLRDAAMKKPKSGDIPLVPGNPDGSHLLSRILSTDPDEVMPPPDAKLPKLTKKETDTLRRWIAEGAEYQDHWSFIPVKPVPIPTDLPNGPKPRNDLDRLVFAHLKQRNLVPRPEAKPEALLRRVTLDLTGLPPTPAQVREFLSDTRPDAYERLVDRLLASPSFGERMATDWLDVARYADSFGFQVDRDREVWPWRDWVVSAFNRNLPFNDFVTWQLAGDLLPNPSEEQVLATAFNRLHQQEAEGGSIEEEYRVEYVNDRVITFGTTFLGLTFECSKCHDHKFDPITQKEFYQLFAFFDDIDEAGLYSFFSPGDAPTPAMNLRSAEEKTRIKQLESNLTSAETQLASVRQSQQSAFVSWLANKPAPNAAIPSEIARFKFDAVDKNHKLANSIDPKLQIPLGGENKIVPGRSGNAIQFSGDDALNLKVGAFNRADPFTISLWIQTPDVKERAVVLHRSKAWTDAASRGFELLIEDGRLKWSMIRFWPGDAASIKSTSPLKTGEWTHVTVSSDGSGKAAGLKLYVNGHPCETEVIKDTLSRDIAPVGEDHIILGERMRDRGFKNGLVDDIRVFARNLSELEVLQTFDENAAPNLQEGAVEKLSPEDKARLFELFLATGSPEYSQALESLKAARTELLGALNKQREIMVMQEIPKPKKAYVLFRGQYDQRRDEVFAGTPASLNPFPKGAPTNRLGLAQWLTDPSNPLLARVTINRYWQSLFGRGITRTADDFGSQGAQPEYPEVLDWLAGQYISNWDTKALLRSVVISHTYRQESAADMKLLTDDPENILLARGPRFRLSAEMIRDTFLQASGLLVDKIGGAPVTPYEMSEAFRPANADKGEGSFRRSLYTRWRRTSPPPAMMSFDASRRAVCAAKRERTNTPLQSLILLNGPQYVEAARVLGEKLHQQHQGNISTMVEDGFLSCLSRFPDNREKEISEALYREQLEYFTSHPEEAKSLLKIGQTATNKNLPEPQAAAATVLAQALLNHDGSVVKQ